MPRARRSVLRAGVVWLLAVSSVLAISTGAGGQEVGGESGVTEAETEVRIVAQRRADGRVEFGLQQRGSDAAWDERLLPSRRFFPVRVEVGRWLWSSPLSVVPESEFGDVPEVQVRIVARRIADGRVEFGLQQRGDDEEWGERRLPSRRFFPTGTRLGRWLSSSPLTLTVTFVLPDYGEFTVGGGARSGETLVAASHGRTCAVRRDGGVACWGRNGARDHLSAAGLDDVVTVSIGESLDAEVHACVLHADGTVSCWGRGSAGQLGQGDFLPQYLPVAVLGLSDAVALAAGAGHTCAVHSDGGVSCWGRGDLGQLGDGTTDSAVSPRRVPGLTDVATIAAGVDSTCAVHRDGSVSCWGWGAALENYDRPQKVRGLDSVVSVGIGWPRTCAARTDGQVYCWETVDGIGPSAVRGIADAVAVSASFESACALLGDGGVVCWGSSNYWGQLGNGTKRPRTVPVRLEGIEDAVALTMSRPKFDGAGVHACAVHADGSGSCWGSNEVGQLGDGTRQTRLAPTPVQQPGRIRADRIPATQTLLMRAWVDEVVHEREAEFPWLRLAWDHIRERARLAPSLGVTAGVARTRCEVSGGSYACRALLMGLNSLERLEVIIHELAHIYDDTTTLTPGTAWGAVQMYFAVTYPDCFVTPGLGPGGEILADTMAHLVVPDAWLTYYARPADCPALPAEPSREAEDVIRAGLAGEVPAWFTENITSGAEFWAAWRAAPYRPALANLAGEFGGLCTTDWLVEPLDEARLPPADTNPFRDGGC